MSIVFAIIGVLAGIIVLVLIIALFVKKEYSVKRSILINQPSQRVFDYIKYVKNQDNFSVWNQLDPSMQKTYTGTDGTVGFLYAWDSTNKKAGKGEQEIKTIIPGEKMDMNLHFIKPFEGRALASIGTTATGINQTTVNWSVDSKMAYPMNIMLLFMDMDKMIGKDLAGGLANLKAVLEK